MKIAQIAPLIESVPPHQYGGTERIVSYLTEELVHKGHEVTLFASGDSVTSATLEPACKHALRKNKNTDSWLTHVLMLEKVAAREMDFDVIHFHTGCVHYSIARRMSVPNLTTHHGRLDLPETQLLFNEFTDIPLISISNNQRAEYVQGNWLGTVYNGIPKDLYSFQPQPGKYLAFLGRISPEKGIDKAIEIARFLDMELLISAKVDKADVAFYESKIKPLLKEPKINFVGEINDQEKNDFLGNAFALLFPIDWPEPFGLVMIEAMACGTPVIAYRCGSVPEIMRQGVSGFIVNNVNDAVTAVEKVASLDRQQCRRYFEKKFTAQRMAAEYLTIYKHMAFQEQLSQIV